MMFASEESIEDRDMRARLRDTLAQLYTTPGAVRLVLNDAGLPPEEIDPAGPPREVWQRVIDVADKRNRRDVLVAVAKRDYPEHPGLSALVLQPLAESECPFPGLAFFDDNRAHVFFGRFNETRAAIDGLGWGDGAHRRWLQIEGASGSGKSSLLRAGVVPGLRRCGVRGGPRDLRVAVLRPGREPLRNLAEAVARALPGTEFDRVHDAFARSDNGLWSVARQHLPADVAMLVVVDQFEEAFTLVAKGSEALARFDGLLAGALCDGDLPLYLVTSIRNDFVGGFASMPRIEALLNSATRYYLPAIGPQALREAIVEPARVVGIVWEEGLIDRVVGDAFQVERGDGGTASALPLVGNVLRLLWDRREARLITNAAYQNLKGVAGALGEAAGQVMESLGPEGRLRAERLLLSLARIHRGGPPTRQPRSRAEVLDAAGGDALAESVLVRLSGGRAPEAPEGSHPARLVVVGGDEDVADPAQQRVDLVHEALLREWATLRDWIKRDRNRLLARDELESAAHQWDERARSDAWLPRDEQLAHYLGANGPDVSSTTRDFLAAARASAERREQEKLVEERRRAQEKAAEEKRRAEEKLRQQKRVTMFTAGAAVLAVVCALSLWRALVSNRRALAAETATARREARQAAALSYVIRVDTERRRLETDATKLWPPLPTQAPAVAAWLERARRLRPEGDTLRRRSVVLGGDADDPRQQHLGRVLADLQRLYEPSEGVIAHVEELQRAVQETARLQVSRRYRSAWTEVIAHASAVSTAERYGHLLDRPIPYLMPIGRDPHSGLFEFAHFLSGDIPDRDGSGALQRTPTMGLIFVCIPGGTFRMGAQRRSAVAANYDASAGPGEAPIHSITLDSFLLSKFEMTQGQWIHLTGRNPSQNNSEARGFGLLTPVDTISWNDAYATLTPIGMTLPTEAQWEYAARAGAEDVRWNGLDSSGFFRFANVRETGRLQPVNVGQYPPNGFGLHDLVGNLWEICLDNFDSYLQPVRPGSGERTTQVPRVRTDRGGSCFDSAVLARPTARYELGSDYKQFNLGVRPAMEH